jgi:hypothetical protein
MRRRGLQDRGTIGESPSKINELRGVRTPDPRSGANRETTVLAAAAVPV